MAPAAAQLLDVLHTGAISFSSRGSVARLSTDFKQREFEAVCGKVKQLCVVFKEPKTATLTPTMMEGLSRVAEVLLEYPEVPVRVEGVSGKLDGETHQTSFVGQWRTAGDVQVEIGSDGIVRWPETGVAERITFQSKSQAYLQGSGGSVINALLRVGYIEWDDGDKWTRIQEDEALKENRLIQLSSERATNCKKALEDYGVVNVIEEGGWGVDSTLEFGLVRVVMDMQAPVIFNPQQRINFILSRRHFEFEELLPRFTPLGLRVADMCARALLEINFNFPIDIVMPKRSSDLAIGRCEAIRQYLLARAVPNVITVSKGTSENQPDLRIDVGTEPVEMGPQAALTSLIQGVDPSLIFWSREDKVAVTRDFVEVLKRCADVLQTVVFLTCQVEVYCEEPQATQQQSSAASSPPCLAAQRARRIGELLREKGALVPIQCVGYVDPARIGQPLVRLTLVEGPDEILGPVL
eukprot:TRINITY_DN5405_c0_g1_i1.p1 TRINITY_DN5405_c0_g1~~TRINITY_DN5405_c0_g1_i1.p1  ORF type:complete len:466 (-),score=83.44 TRINITY_DN5405_c0_g1_i1:302-1699(-)